MNTIDPFGSIVAKTRKQMGRTPCIADQHLGIFSGGEIDGDQRPLPGPPQGPYPYPVEDIPADSRGEYLIAEARTLHHLPARSHAHSIYLFQWVPE